MLSELSGFFSTWLIAVVVCAPFTVIIQVGIGDVVVSVDGTDVSGDYKLAKQVWCIVYFLVSEKLIPSGTVSLVQFLLVLNFLCFHDARRSCSSGRLKLLPRLASNETEQVPLLPMHTFSQRAS